MNLHLVRKSSMSSMGPHYVQVVVLHTIATAAVVITHDLLEQGLRVYHNSTMRRIVQCQIFEWHCD